MLTRHSLAAPVPALRLDLHSQRLGLRTEHSSTALKVFLIDIRLALERIITRTKNARAVQPEDIAWQDTGHLEGQADLVALCNEIGESVNVRGDIVRRLSAKEGQELCYALLAGGLRGRGASL